jgi:NAD dependent epimerase/dehydratase
MSLAGKSVLVTGAAGFIGSHLTEALVAEGAKTSAFVHYNSAGSRGWLDDSPVVGDIEFIAGDICDRDSVTKAVAGVDIVFHLAALIAIPYSYQAPLSYLRTNVEGTLNVLQAGLAAQSERIIHTSTSEVYGTALYVPIDEKHPLQGQSPYAASKIGADKMVEAFYSSFELPVVTVRPFNTFGPRQSTRAVIPTIITQCLRDDVVRLGSLHPTRDFNYVANTVSGFVRAAAAEGVVGQTVNLGSGYEVSIGELAETVINIVGRSVDIECEQQRLRPDKSEVERLLADGTLAKELMGWEPSVDFVAGLERTIEWLRKYLEGYRIDEYSV